MPVQESPILVYALPTSSFPTLSIPITVACGSFECVSRDLQYRAQYVSLISDVSESAHLKLVTLETDQCVKQCTSLPEKNWCTGRPAKKTVVAVRKGRIPQPANSKSRRSARART